MKTVTQQTLHYDRVCVLEAGDYREGRTWSGANVKAGQ